MPAHLWQSFIIPFWIIYVCSLNSWLININRHPCIFSYLRKTFSGRKFQRINNGKDMFSLFASKLGWIWLYTFLIWDKHGYIHFSFLICTTHTLFTVRIFYLHYHSFPYLLCISKLYICFKAKLKFYSLHKSSLTIPVITNI